MNALSRFFCPENAMEMILLKKNIFKKNIYIRPYVK